MTFVSCGVKNFPKQTPFVYQNKIEIKEKLWNKEDKKILIGKLTSQLDDSMQVRIKEKMIVLKQVVNPSTFDTIAANRSKRNIETYLKTIGYYNANCKYEYRIDTVKDQQRVTTTFMIHAGKPFRIDSLSYIFTDSINNPNTQELQNICDLNMGSSFLKKKTIFNEGVISNELDRLTNLFKNNGYFNFSRDLLYVDADTVFLPLLNPSLNPFERLKILQQAYEKRENPTINVIIKLSPLAKPSQLNKYKVGALNFYPDYAGLFADSSISSVASSNNVFVRQHGVKFNPKYIWAHNYIQPGKIVNTNDINRTFDEFNSLGSWQFIKIEPKINYVSDTTKNDTLAIDFNFFMIPVKKYAFSADLESVFNQTQQVSIGTAGNLIGLGLNLGFRNKNFDRQGIVIAHTIRGGIEAGIGQINQGLQATELTYNNSVTIPKLWGLGNTLNKKFLYKRTLLNANLSFIDRNVNANGLFRLTNIGASFGWQIKNKRDELITFRPAYIEFVNLYNISDAFQKQLDTTPFLRFSFSQGLVLGNINFSFFKPQPFGKNKINHFSSLRFSLEESGLLYGRFKNAVPAFQKYLFEYIKTEIELKYEIKKTKTSWAFRMAAGAGFILNDSTNMPFFKQFTGGGPNSMRAWPLRSIGPGATPLEKREGRNQFFSRSGDMIWETNAEFRYNIATIIPNTFVIRGALFTDIGNIWNLPNQTNRNNDTVVFHLKNLYRDLSVSAGTGFRFDFTGLFMIRLDFALRMKDPALPTSEKNYGWRNPKPSLANFFSSKEEHRQWRYENFNLSIGINYPF
ncbi:MAG: BamA/TamA family outer membrane protein [Bacteroidota bacterium]